MLAREKGIPVSSAERGLRAVRKLCLKEKDLSATLNPFFVMQEKLTHTELTENTDKAEGCFAKNAVDILAKAD